MIAQLNRQRVLNLLDAYYSGDIEGALALCSDDVESIAPAPIEILPHLGHRRGKAEVREMWKAVHSRYASARYEVAIMIAEGDKVAALIRAFFRKSDDRVLQFNTAVFYSFRDGQITEIREIIDSFDLVQQVVERDIAAVLAASKPDKA